MTPKARISVCLLGAALAGLAGGCERTPKMQPQSPPPTAATNDPVLASTPVARFIAEAGRDPLLRSAEIRLTVLSGGVRLHGFVHNAAAKLRAAELAREITGLSAVENRLIVRRPPGMAQMPLAEARIYL